MFAQSDQLYLPLVLIDVSEIRSDRRQPKRSKAAESSPRPSRVSGLAASARATIVRLIPGQTRLPFEPVGR
jgi:hypothetical protein